MLKKSEKERAIAKQINVAAFTIAGEGGIR